MAAADETKPERDDRVNSALAAAAWWSKAGRDLRINEDGRDISIDELGEHLVTLADAYRQAVSP